jgi:hypothetical protein
MAAAASPAASTAQAASAALPGLLGRSRRKAIAHAAAIASQVSECTIAVPAS